MTEYLWIVAVIGPLIGLITFVSLRMRMKCLRWRLKMVIKIVIKMVLWPMGDLCCNSVCHQWAVCWHSLSPVALRLWSPMALRRSVHQRAVCGETVSATSGPSVVRWSLQHTELQGTGYPVEDDIGVPSKQNGQVACNLLAMELLPQDISKFPCLLKPKHINFDYIKAKIKCCLMEAAHYYGVVYW